MPGPALLQNPDIARLAAALKERQPELYENSTMRRAAVALVFRAGHGGDPELLFIKRAEYSGDPWSGHVAFPGGRREPGDESLEQTAIRETREETGIDLAAQGVVLGMLDELRPQSVSLPEIVVCPFVAVLHEPPVLTLTSEVAAAFWLPLASLRDPSSWRDTDILAQGVQLRRRAYRHEGDVIWGITERILAQLVELIG